MKISVILPLGKSDYLANTVLDGLIDLQNEKKDLDIIFTKNYPSPFDLNKYEKNDEDFIVQAKQSDIIILTWGKNSTNFILAEKINEWQKTVFIDGSELGKNNRLNSEITDQVLNGTYSGIGAINTPMLLKCKLYFRREKPYIKGITPFPFGIETRYRKYFKTGIKRDIDFTCVFGQDEYPILRRQVKEYTEKFSKENGFKCHTKRTSGFNFDDNSKKAGRDDFYEILSRTKIGISVGGGGYDTARFWEILANGSLLLTEKIDIYHENEIKEKLNYKRIIQFKDFEDFKIKIKELGEYIKTDYENDKIELDNEYLDVIEKHSTKARVKEIINYFNKK